MRLIIGRELSFAYEPVVRPTERQASDTLLSFVILRKAKDLLLAARSRSFASLRMTKLFRDDEVPAINASPRRGS